MTMKIVRERACQAEWQFRNCLRAHMEALGPMHGGIVIFAEFSGDWNRRHGGRLLETGWSHWYRGHCQIHDGFHVCLLRLAVSDTGPRAEGLVGFYDAKKLAELRMAVRVGIEEAEQGLAVDLNQATLDRVKADGRQRARQQP